MAGLQLSGEELLSVGQLLLAEPDYRVGGHVVFELAKFIVVCWPDLFLEDRELFAFDFLLE